MFLEHGFQSKICGGGNKRKKDRLELRDWIVANKDKVFCEYLPFPSRISFVIEEEASQAYIDKNVKECINAAQSILSIGLSVTTSGLDDPKSMEHDQKIREDRAVLASVQLSNFYKAFSKDNIGGKTGWARKHVYGSRLNFTFRGVITSIFNPHDYRDIHLPWPIAVNIFSLHLSNKLLRKGYTPRDINRLIMEYTNVYHPLLAELMDEIIKEHPSGKFPIIFQRNPSLSRLSAQQLYVVSVKKDPSIRSISLSLLVLRGMNADFDGKQSLPSINSSNCWKLSKVA